MLFEVEIGQDFGFCFEGFGCLNGRLFGFALVFKRGQHSIQCVGR